MRLCFVIHGLGMGGAERTLTALANMWVAKGHDVAVVTLDDGRESPFFALDRRVARRSLEMAAPSANLLSAASRAARRIWALRRAIRQIGPDVVISFIDTTNVLAILATRGLGVPIMACERTHPAFSPVNRIWKMLRRCTYGWAERIVVQGAAAEEFFSPAMRKRTAVIPNPVFPSPQLGGDTLRLARPAVVAMGRLSAEKRFDLLLRAFASVRERHTDWTLHIFGEGPQRGQLEGLRDRLGLGVRALLPGPAKKPDEALRHADLFVISSDFEGFPNALCEAMAAGRPVIATDSPGATGEIVRHDVDGLLVSPGSAEALAEAMDRMMSDGALRQRLGAKAAEIVERFSPDRILALWSRELASVMRTAA